MDAMRNGEAVKVRKETGVMWTGAGMCKKTCSRIQEILQFFERCGR